MATDTEKYIPQVKGNAERHREKYTINCCREVKFFTSPRNRGGVIFSLQFVCVSVCVCLCVRHFL